MCKYCEFDNEDQTNTFYGSETYSVDGAGADVTISNEIIIHFVDENHPHILAFASIFGKFFESKSININYCPFCGRKL